MSTEPLIVQVLREPHAEGLPLPEAASAEAAGMDLRAAVPADAPMTLAPGGRGLVPTGLRIALPPGFEAQVRPRSGLALKHGIGVLNSPGTIDADYRGEIGIILFNSGPAPFVIHRGDRIAQMVIQRVERAAVVEVRSMVELGTSRRGDGGFGHTGVK